jgi:alcohol dehydrogenase (cytochrome c)
MPLRLWHKVLLFIGALTVIGAVTGGALYYACPVQVSILAALTRNCIVTLSAPAGTTRTESNSAYKTASAAAAQPSSAASSQGADWPSYNKTRTSERFSPLSQINPKNAANLRVCALTTSSSRTFSPAC